MDSFDKLNELFSVFTGDSELMGLLGVPEVTFASPMMPEDQDIALADANVRRSFADPTLIVPGDLPFIDMSFLESYSETGNFLVSRPNIEINIYAVNYHQASQVFKAVKRILKANFEDAQCYYSGQRSVPLPEIYCYSMRIKQFVES